MELKKVFEWFNANTLFLNKDKIKYKLFLKAREKDNVPLKLPSSFICDKEIKRITSINYLGALIDKHVTWKEDIIIIEKNVSKNVYFSFMYSCWNYGNIVWDSSIRRKLKKLAS